MESLLPAFVDYSGASSLSGNRKAVNWQKEEEKKERIDIGYDIITLLCMCVYLILIFLAEEGICDANDNEGDDKDEDKDDDNKDEEEDDNDNEMGRIPAAGRAGAAGRTAHARCSPPRPAVAPAAYSRQC